MIPYFQLFWIENWGVFYFYKGLSNEVFQVDYVVYTSLIISMTTLQIYFQFISLQIPMQTMIPHPLISCIDSLLKKSDGNFQDPM